MKTTKLRQLPNILVVTFKRFEFKNSNWSEKLNNLVDFPVNGLDMKAHCALYSDLEIESGVGGNSELDATYDLFAVVNHFGRFGFGHYTVYARSWANSKEGEVQGPMDDTFSCFDDSAVAEVKRTNDVITNAAYCLMYRRRVFT